jgi:hypothetical protein
MDDTLKNLAFGFLALIVLHGSLEKRAKHDANRQIKEAFNNTGGLQTRVEARGMFGAFVNDLYSVEVLGQHQKVDHLPFLIIPRNGWKGSIRHLRLHLTDLTLKGLPVERFDADIPFVTYDLGHALYRDRLVLRGAGAGPASVRIGREGLQKFILTKFRRTLSGVQVEISNGKVVISGNLLLFTGPTAFHATGDLLPRGGRYLDLVNPEIRLSGSPLTPEAAASLLKGINPVLDVESDLGLGGYFTITQVEIREGFVLARGSATIPLDIRHEIKKP